MVSSVRDEDGLEFREAQQQGARLCNTEMLKSLESLLEHLEQGQSAAVTAVIRAFPSLFWDVPGRTTVRLSVRLPLTANIPTKEGILAIS